MKRMIQFCVSCLLFSLIFSILFVQLSDILIPKPQNRYYILEKYLDEHPEQTQHDVQVFGSCHSYTSFDPIYLEKKTGVSSFVYGSAGEIIPTTYLRMAEQFKKHVPKVALVEIWGINPYETYDSQDNIFGDYLSANLERLDFSLEKQEVIRDFDYLELDDGRIITGKIDFLKTNFPIVNYKDRLLDGSLTSVDFNYSFEGTEPFNSGWLFDEMSLRLSNNGFKRNPSTPIPDYPNLQANIGNEESTAIEHDIVKYLYKIVEMCKENEVTLIFYRSPYISTENELKKVITMQQICEEQDILFFDLEKEIEYDYTIDFYDYEHLSENGAAKSTEFLIPYILQALNTETQEI